MADELVRCRVLLGQQDGDIRALLGRPDETLRNEWSYLIGEERGPVKLDSEYLMVVFGADGKVDNALIAG
jgi:hypothetical protein